MIKYIVIINLLFCIDSEARVYQLKELVAKALIHPEIQIEQFEVNKAETLFTRIDGEMRPRMTILSGIGPNKSSTGNAINSVRSAKVDTVTYLTTIDLKIPVFMFNRQSDLHRAAEGNLKVKELDVQKKQLELVKKVKEYYYGFQYASSLNEFAGSTLKDLDDALSEMKNNKKSNNEELTKLQLFRSLAQVKKYEIEKGLALGILGLKYITQDENPEVEQDWIEYSERPLPSLETINSQLASSNIDLRKANLGMEAKQAFLTSEKKSQLPVFGIFSSFDYRSTPKAEKQTSKFAYDPYNRSDFSVGVGLIWDIDFGIKSSNVSNAQIELETLKVQEAYAKKNLPLKMEKIYLELVEAQKKATELEKSYKTSKKMLNSVASGVVLGIAPAKDIIESYTLKAQIYQQYVEAIYNYEMKLADLSFEMGKELDPAL